MNAVEIRKLCIMLYRNMQILEETMADSVKSHEQSSDEIDLIEIFVLYGIKNGGLL